MDRSITSHGEQYPRAPPQLAVFSSGGIDRDDWVYSIDLSTDGGRSWNEGQIEMTFRRSEQGDVQVDCPRREAAEWIIDQADELTPVDILNEGVTGSFRMSTEAGRLLPRSRRGADARRDRQTGAASPGGFLSGQR